MDFFDKIRISMDRRTKETLNIDLIGVIIEEWVRHEEKRLFDIRIDCRYSTDLICSNDCNISRPELYVNDKLWSRFKKICAKRNIRVDIGFRLAIVFFMDNHCNR